MFIGRITGSLVSTQKVDELVGQKLLLVEPLRVNEQDQSDLQPTGRSFVVIDTVGADRVVLGTDYPAPMFLKDPVRWLDGLPEITDAEAEAILQTNPQRLMGMTAGS